MKTMQVIKSNNIEITRDYIEFERLALIGLAYGISIAHLQQRRSRTFPDLQRTRIYNFNFELDSFSLRPTCG